MTAQGRTLKDDEKDEMIRELAMRLREAERIILSRQCEECGYTFSPNELLAEDATAWGHPCHQPNLIPGTPCESHRKFLRCVDPQTHSLDPLLASSSQTVEENSGGVGLIAAERARQRAKEGYSDAHDDAHIDFEMMRSAVAYALHAGGFTNASDHWPFGSCEWKPSAGDPVRDLTKAGALIAAEIDRIQRLQGNASANSGVALISAVRAAPLVSSSGPHDEEHDHGAGLIHQVASPLAETEPRPISDRCIATHPETGQQCELQNSHHYEKHQANLRWGAVRPMIEWPVEMREFHCEAFEADGRRIGGFVVTGSSMGEALFKASKNGEVKIRPWQHTIRVSELKVGCASLSNEHSESSATLPSAAQENP